MALRDAPAPGTNVPTLGAGGDPPLTFRAPSREPEIARNTPESTEATQDPVGNAYRAMVDIAPDGVLVADAAGLILFVNPMLAQLFGYTPEELFAMAVEDLVPEELRTAHAEHRKGWNAHPAMRPMATGLELYGRRRDGSRFPIEVSLSILPNGRLTLAVVRDVTERRKAAEALREAHERLALVDDRERIARDLHDGVVQRLFAIGLSLQSAQARCEVPEVGERLDRAIDEIDAAIREIRTTIFALNARRSPGAGTRDDVLLIAREAGRALGFEPRVVFDGPVDTSVPDPIGRHLVATLREALANVARHAQASRVTVEVGAGAELMLRVTDDGVGFRDQPGPGSGIVNMRTRAHDLGGRCTFRAGADGGTVVEWVVPLEA